MWRMKIWISNRTSDLLRSLDYIKVNECGAHRARAIWWPCEWPRRPWTCSSRTPAACWTGSTFLRWRSQPGTRHLCTSRTFAGWISGSRCRTRSWHWWGGCRWPGPLSRPPDSTGRADPWFAAGSRASPWVAGRSCCRGQPHVCWYQPGQEGRGWWSRGGRAGQQWAAPGPEGVGSAAPPPGTGLWTLPGAAPCGGSWAGGNADRWRYADPPPAAGPCTSHWASTQGPGRRCSAARLRSLSSRCHWPARPHPETRRSSAHLYLPPSSSSWSLQPPGFHPVGSQHPGTGSES